MTTLLESQVTNFLASQLGRAPTASEVAQGMLAPWTLASVHNSLNVGTSVFSIDSTMDIQTAIDEAHAQGGGTIYLQPGVYALTANLIGYSSIALAGVSPDSTVLDFGATAYGVVFDSVTDASLSNFAVQNTTGTAVTISNSTKVSLENVEANGCGIGFVIDICSEVFAQKVLAVGNTGDGFQLTALSLVEWQSANAISNGGNGFTFDTVASFSGIPMAANNNTGEGFKLTSVTNGTFLVAAEGNASHGVEFVSGCSGVDFLSGDFTGNTGDGARLTASAANCKFNLMDVVGNGGYGINIVDSSSVGNLILGNSFAGNTTAAANDSGTSTLIRSNIGLADSP